MEDLNKGEVAITLGERNYILKPSLRAYSTLSTRFVGYGDIIDQIVKNNIPTMMLVIQLGLDMKESDAQRLKEMMFRTSSVQMGKPLIDYVFRLFNNGMSPEEVNATFDQSTEGNGEMGEE